jgi:hypothetical protein
VAFLVVFLLVQAARQNAEPLVPFALFRNRNFAVSNWVLATVAIALMGIFLPLTIYLQSVLGFSALKAGLALAPASVISMFVAPAAGRLTDRIGGKYILMTGLACFAVGMGWIALIAHINSAWYDFAAPLLVAGFGMGCTFAPMTTVAMRDIEPRMAGAASGMLNTTRQVSAVIGTAAVGALLQNRLTDSLTSQARTRTAGRPAQVQHTVMSAVQHTAKTGTVGGTGSSRFHAPPGTPPGFAHEIGQLLHAIFGYGFVDAMRATMVMPIVVLAVGVVSCLAIKGGRAQARPAEPEETKTTSRV